MTSPTRQPKVLVAIPAYNCEKQIVRVLRSFTPQLLERLHRVVVFDNRSKDNTVEAALGAAREIGSDKIVVCRNRENYGLGGTHKVAFLRAEEEGCDYVAILHGDDQAKTGELGLLLDDAERNPHAAAVLGSRFMLRSKLQGYSLTRIVGNVGLNAVYSVACARATKDLGSGLNLFRIEDLRGHEFLGFTNALNFNNDLLLFYFAKKVPLRFVPITWSETDQVSNARNFKVGFEALKRLAAWRLGGGPAPLALRDYESDRVAA